MDEDQRIIRLNVTSAVQHYAESHGALYENDVGWYCYHPVPAELEELTIDQVYHNSKPGAIEVQCPRCGGQMTVRTSRNFNVFWGCMTYPKCNGIREIDETETNHFSKVTKPERRAHRRVTKDSNRVINVAHNFDKLLQLGIEKFGDDESFKKWFARPKVFLDGKSPISVVGTEEGFSKIFEVLEDF